ncbi:MAG TPA: hypothetical protein DHV80_06725 [Acidimicrobiaceae bacterium]|nr:hypothetical protein [Acidimicrobiaceae bacterium]
MGRMKLRIGACVLSVIAMCWVAAEPGGAEGKETELSALSDSRSAGFDPWGATHHRWPSLVDLHIGQEEHYYYWSRPNQRSLLRERTDTNPLNIWVGGDSLAGGPALGFRELVREGGWVYTEDVRKSTGVVSDWYFDWRKHLEEEVADGPYEVIVLSIGGNDWQGFRGGPTEKGSAEWAEKYLQRIQEIFQILDRPGRLLIWVGMPHFKVPFMVPLTDVVNAITREVFSNGERSVWVNAASIVSPGGAWTKHVMRENGELLEVRTDDGTHYQSSGARLITDAVVAAVALKTG